MTATRRLINSTNEQMLFTTVVQTLYPCEYFFYFLLRLISELKLLAVKNE